MNPGQATTLTSMSRREREERAREIAAEVGEAAKVFQHKITGTMDRLAARKALAEFVRTYTSTIASPYAGDAEQIAKDVLAIFHREARARYGLGDLR